MLSNFQHGNGLLEATGLPIQVLRGMLSYTFHHFGSGSNQFDPLVSKETFLLQCERQK